MLSTMSSFTRIGERAIRRKPPFSDVLSARSYDYTISDVQSTSLITTLRAVVKDAIDSSGTDTDDWIQVLIVSKHLDMPIRINNQYVKRSEFDYENLTREIERINQSQKTVSFLKDGIGVKVYCVKRLHGHGKRKTCLRLPNDTKLCLSRCITIDAERDCFTRCVVYCMREVDQLTGTIRKGIPYKDNLKSWQRNENKESIWWSTMLLQRCGVENGTSIGSEHWKLFGDYLRKKFFRLIIYDSKGKLLY